MELGQRIKQARLERGLSQRQLCGEEITRNMLSQIENGSARPSMATLTFLARQLDKPISFFLEEDVAVLPNQPVMDQLRQAYTQGEYEKIPALLEQYRAPDEVFDRERYLLEALGLMKLARQAQLQRKTVYAQTLLQRAGEAGKNSAYYTDALERERLLQLYELQPQQAVLLAQKLPQDRREQMLRATAALDTGKADQAAAILDAAPEAAAPWQYLRGHAAMKTEDYKLAVQCFLQAEQTYPMECAKALEECYRQLEDYKQAYFYACKQR
ncbi:MAG: helix-turn-helix domain-containing protein [Oscillospiraceae bacterium]|nr:helix-turn-helix domain-containing protein [Oscillospiraceae bacterium]